MPQQRDAGIPNSPTSEKSLAKLHQSTHLSPQEQAERFLACMKGTECDDDDDDDGADDDPKVKGRPAAKINKNGGGAAAKSKGKAKAKAKSKSNATGKLAVPGWSMARRMKEYPKGCGKCRNCPACTCSCFKYRGQVDKWTPNFGRAHRRQSDQWGSLHIDAMMGQ